MKSIFFLFFFLLANQSFACPIGAREDHLTLQRVMRNFGKYSREAESVALLGVDNPTYVNEENLDKAILDLNMVVVCVNTVLSNPSGDLLPDDAKKLSGEDLNQFLTLFTQYLSEFKKATLEFQKLLINEKSKAVTDRNYKPIYKFDKEIFNPIIDKAHKEL